MLKIQRSANGKVVYALSGRIEESDLAELRRLLAGEKADQHIVLDLKNVTIVDRDAVKFFSRCGAKGIQLANCPAYIREWMVKERTNS